MNQFPVIQSVSENTGVVERCATFGVYALHNSVLRFFISYKHPCSIIADICCLLVLTCAKDPGWHFQAVLWHNMTTILWGLKFLWHSWLRWQSFGLWHFDDLGTVTEAAEGFTASIFKMVMALASYHDHWMCFSLSKTTKSFKQFILLGLSWRLEAASSSEELVTKCQSQQCHIPEDSNHEYLW